MSRGTKIALAITLGLLALCCLVAIVFLALLPRIGENFSENVVADSPEEAAEIADGITDYELPAGYHTELGFETFGISTVFIGPENFATDSMAIALMQFPEFMASDPETMRQQMEQSFAQQSGQSGVTLTEVDRQAVTIRGDEATLVIMEGTDDQGNNIRQALAAFEGRGGPAMLMIYGSQDSWDQDLVDAFIDSMRE